MAQIDSAIVTNTNTTTYGYTSLGNYGYISNDVFNITGTPTILEIKWISGTPYFTLAGSYSSNTEWTSITIGSSTLNRTAATISTLSSPTRTQYSWTSMSNPFNSGLDSQTTVTWDGTAASGSSDFQVTLYFDGTPSPGSFYYYGNNVALNDVIEVTLDTTLNSESPYQQSISDNYNWEYLFSKNATCTNGLTGGDGEKSFIRCDANFDNWYAAWKFLYSLGKTIKIKMCVISGSQRAPLQTTNLSMNSIHINVSKTSTVSQTTCSLNDADFRAIRATDSTYDGGDGINKTPGTTISIGEFRNATAGPFLLQSYYRAYNGSTGAFLDYVSTNNRAMMVTDNGYSEYFVSYQSAYSFTSGPVGGHDIKAGDWVVFSFDYVTNWDDGKSPLFENNSSSQTLVHKSWNSANLSEITTVEDYLVIADSGISYTWDNADLGNIDGGNYHNRRMASFSNCGDKQRWQVSWLTEVPSDWIGSSKTFAMNVPEEMNTVLVNYFT